MAGRPASAFIFREFTAAPAWIVRLWFCEHRNILNLSCQVPNLLRESVRTQLEADVRAATEDIRKTNDQADTESDSAKQRAMATEAKAGVVASDLAKVAERTKSLAHTNLDEELKLARMELRRVDEVIFGKHLGQGELGAAPLLLRCCVCPPSSTFLPATSFWPSPYYFHEQCG